MLLGNSTLAGSSAHDRYMTVPFTWESDSYTSMDSIPSGSYVYSWSIIIETPFLGDTSRLNMYLQGSILQKHLAQNIILTQQNTYTDYTPQYVTEDESGHLMLTLSDCNHGEGSGFVLIHYSI